MGLCTICGKKAGVFKAEHQECRTKIDQITSSFQDSVARFVIEGGDAARFVAVFRAQADRFPRWDSTEFFSRELIGIARSFQSQQQPSSTQIENLKAIWDPFGFSNDKMLAFTDETFKTKILAQIHAGETPDNINVEIPLILTKDEYVVWVTFHVQHFAVKKHTSYVGSSAGVSIRAAKGVYLRSGAYKGDRVEQLRMEIVSNDGLLYVTNRHVFYYAGIDVVKVPLNKIAAIQHTGGGIEIAAEGSSARPHFFLTPNDSPFLAELIRGMFALNG